MKTLNDVSERIRQIRKELRITQSKYAEILGVSRSYLSEVESGKSKPNVNMLVGLAKFVPDVDMQWVLTGEKNTATAGYSLDLHLMSSIGSIVESYFLSYESGETGILDPFRNCTDQQKEIIKELTPLISRFRKDHARLVCSISSVIYEKVSGIKDESLRQETIQSSANDHVRVAVQNMHMQAGDVGGIKYEIGSSQESQDT